MSKIDLTSRAWCDLIFEDRNKAYGAYAMRMGTTKRNIWSLIIVLILALLAIVGPYFVELVKPAEKVENTQVTELSALVEKKKAEVKKKAPIKIEEVKPVEKVKSSVKFTAPVIKKDEEVKEEDEIKTQDQIMETKTTIGGFDVKGNDETGGEILKAKEIIAQPEPVKEEEEKVFDVVEQMPSYPGGQAALFKYLSANIVYPSIAEENGVQGKVYLKFCVEKDGSIGEVLVLKSLDPSCDREAARVVKSMPRWIPGKQTGQAVRVWYTLPVVFKLQ